MFGSEERANNANPRDRHRVPARGPGVRHLQLTVGMTDTPSRMVGRPPAETRQRNAVELFSSKEGAGSARTSRNSRTELGGIHQQGPASDHSESRKTKPEKKEDRPLSGTSRTQRSNRVGHREVAQQWAATGVEFMVKHSRECGRPGARGSRNWQRTLQYLMYVSLKSRNGTVHLSVEQLARHTGIDERTVRRITSLAQASGVLTLEEAGGRRRRGGQVIHRANSWRVHPRCRYAPPSLSRTPTGGENSARRADENDSPSASLMEDTFVSPDPLRGPKTPTGGASSAPPDETEPIDTGSGGAEFFEWYWKGRHRRTR